MRISLQPAFVLHRRPYRETSLLVDLFVQNFGRITVVARGVKGKKSPLKALLQPFNPILVSWQGKSELMTLISAESVGVPIQLQGECLLSAFYLNELLVRVLQKQDPYPEFYRIYHETLLKLQSKPASLQKTLRIFEKKLLEALGYGLQLQYDIPHGNPFVYGQYYRFYPEYGFKLVQKDENKDLVFKGDSIIALANEQLDQPEFLKDAKRLIRLALAPLLGTKPLQSRTLFTEVTIE